MPQLCKLGFCLVENSKPEDQRDAKLINIQLDLALLWEKAPVTKFYGSLVRCPFSTCLSKSQISSIVNLFIFTFVVLDTLRPLSHLFNNSAPEKYRYIPELLLWSWQLSYSAEFIRKVHKNHLIR